MIQSAFLAKGINFKSIHVCNSIMLVTDGVVPKCYSLKRIITDHAEKNTQFKQLLEKENLEKS